MNFFRTDGVSSTRRYSQCLEPKSYWINGRVVLLRRMMFSYLAQVWKVGQIQKSVSFTLSAQESGLLRFNSAWKGRLIATHPCGQKTENRHQRKEREEAESGWRWDPKDAVSSFLTFPHCKTLTWPHKVSKFFLTFHCFYKLKENKAIIHWYIIENVNK